MICVYSKELEIALNKKFIGLWQIHYVQPLKIMICSYINQSVKMPMIYYWMEKVDFRTIGIALKFSIGIEHA
jgi:hypothetical protein